MPSPGAYPLAPSRTRFGVIETKRVLLAALLVAAFAAPALAATLCVVSNESTKQCSVAMTPPTETERFSMMVQSGSDANAKIAMAGTIKCRKKD